MSLELNLEPEWSEARADLYKGHEVKKELVLGPIVLQPPDFVYNLNGQNIKQEATDPDKTVVTPTMCVKQEFIWETERNISQGPKREGERSDPCVTPECAMTHVNEVVKQELLKCEADDCKQNGIYQDSPKDPQQASTSHLTKPQSTRGGGLTTEKLSLQRQPEPRLSSRMRIQYETDTEDAQKSIFKSKRPKIFECNYCGKRFSFKQVLINHIRIHTKEKPYSCKICSKKFSDCAVLVRHRRMHAGQKPHACDICSKRYSEKYLLKNHKLTHTGEWQYFCKLCSKTFVNSSNYRRHQKVHMHKYSCDICKKHFKKKESLVTHIMCHMKTKPYICKVCGKGFTLSGHLNRHLAIHTGLKTVHTCGLCNKAFSQKGSLTKHVNRKVCERKR